MVQRRFRGARLIDDGDFAACSPFRAPAADTFLLTIDVARLFSCVGPGAGVGASQKDILRLPCLVFQTTPDKDIVPLPRLHHGIFHGKNLNWNNSIIISTMCSGREFRPGARGIDGTNAGAAGAAARAFPLITPAAALRSSTVRGRERVRAANHRWAHPAAASEPASPRNRPPSIGSSSVPKIK
jgi:hypothetical protein